MFNVTTERNAIEHYMETHQVEDFVYDGLVGLIAFDMYCTDHPAFMLELVCVHLDKKMGINGKGEDWPKLPNLVQESLMYVVYVFQGDEMITRAECKDMKHAIGMMKDHVEVWCTKPEYKVTIAYEKNSN